MRNATVRAARPNPSEVLRAVAARVKRLGYGRPCSPGGVVLDKHQIARELAELAKALEAARCTPGRGGRPCSWRVAAWGPAPAFPSHETE